MGFLLGDVYVHRGNRYALARDAVTTDLDASSVSVRFQREGFPKLLEDLDDIPYDYIIVGWYHSHPGYGCFMSPKDVETQKKMFSEDYHSAIVVDPLNMQIEAFSLVGQEVKRRPFVVFWEDYEDPYGKMRKLAIR